MGKSLPSHRSRSCLDIAFVPDDLNHGFLLGTRQTILETKYGGITWVPRSIPSAEDEGFNYRFNSISFNGKKVGFLGNLQFCCTLQMLEKAGKEFHKVLNFLEIWYI